MFQKSKIIAKGTKGISIIYNIKLIANIILNWLLPRTRIVTNQKKKKSWKPFSRKSPKTEK